MSSMTPEKLQQDPTILLTLRSYDSTTALRSFEGKVGAVVGNGAYFVTSPNMDHIWMPPPNTTITFKHDIRVGAHDPLSWLQPYIAPFAYLAAICRRPATLTKNDPFYIAFHNLEDCDLDLSEDGALGGLYVLQSELVSKARAFVDAHIDPKLEECTKGHGGSDEHVLRTMHPSIHRHITYLKELPMSRRQILFIFAELQRYLLEFTATYDFLTVYAPRIKGTLPAATTVEEGVIGAYVNSLNDAEDFFRAGLPVWLIRPAKYAGSIRIDALVEALNPCDFLCLDDASHLYAVEFRGDLTDPERYMTFGRYARQILSYGNSFHFMETTTSLSQAPTPRSSTARHQTKPYTIPKQLPRFDDPVSELMPHSPVLWLRAVRELNTDPNRIRCTRSAEGQRGYILPNAALFLGTATAAKCNTYISNWLQYHSFFIYQLTTAGGQSFLNAQLWRDILNSSPTPTSPQNQAALTKAQKRRQLLVSILPQTVLNTDNLDIREYNTTSPTISWRGQTLTYGQEFGAQTIQEILWEISELNFCFDLLSLDRHLYRSELDNWGTVHRYSSSEDNILLSLPGGASSSLLIADLADAGDGLGSPDWMIRHCVMVALRIVMRCWAGFAELAEKSPDSVLCARLGAVLSCREEMYIPFEKSLTAVYVRLFFDAFDRPPSLPRNLS